MTARIFIADVPLHQEQRPDFARPIPYGASMLDDALVCAGRAFGGGAMVWWIKEASQAIEWPANIEATRRALGLLP